MKTSVVLLFGLLAGATVQAQTRTGHQVQFDARSGPVTVTSVQPTLPNLSDYQVTVADLDRDGNGYIDRGEVPDSHALASEFKLVDRNHDGRISSDELAGWK